MAPKSTYTRSPLTAKLCRLRDKFEDLPPEEKTLLHDFVGTMSMVQDEHRQEAYTHRKMMENEMGSIRLAVEHSNTEIMAKLNKRGMVATISSGAVKNWPWVLLGILVAGGSLSELFNITQIIKGLTGQ